MKLQHWYVFTVQSLSAGGSARRRSRVREHGGTGAGFGIRGLTGFAEGGETREGLEDLPDPVSLFAASGSGDRRCVR